MTQQAEPVPDTKTPPPMMAVRYGYLGWVGQFRHDPALKVKYADRVVIKTERGLEIGTPLAAGCAENCPKFVRPEQVETYVRASGEDYLQRGAGEVVRAATAEDLAEQRRIDAQAKDKLIFCGHAAAKAGLQMRMVACEHLLGGERIIFYFTAEGRIDFRQLVRELAREYHTRIEMRQIGARDEARIVADFEICGRECCCKNFLKILRPVNMKMAKLQKATLDPTKVSGRCGRLRCCLRYEQQTYEELDSRLPDIGTRVKVEQGIGFIRERQVITQILVLDMGEGRRVAVPLEEIQEILPPGAGQEGEAPPMRRRGRGPDRSEEGIGEPPARRRRDGDGKPEQVLAEDDNGVPAGGPRRGSRPEDRGGDERRTDRPDEAAGGEPGRRSRRDRSRRRPRREGAPGAAGEGARAPEPRDPSANRSPAAEGSAPAADNQDVAPTVGEGESAGEPPREDGIASSGVPGQPGRSGRRRRRRRRPRGGGSGGEGAGSGGGGQGSPAAS